MKYSTSEICDIFYDQVDVVETMFFHYGDKISFSGQIHTVKCHEDNSAIIKALEIDGTNKVLVIDGGGSLRKALIDAEIADIALANNWLGLIVYGSVRDVDYLTELDLGILALNSIPAGCLNNEEGSVDIPINFGGVTFLPLDYIYVDNTGVVLSQELLDDEIDTSV